MRRAIGLRTSLATAAVLLGLVGLPASALAQGTFGYRKAITVNGGAGGLAGGPHLDFPLLVSLPNDASLLARVAAGGRDIVFRGEDATTCGPSPSPCVLSHEIERYDGATGTLVAWVRVPSVNVGTVIYMYYGNAQITRDTETPAGVWDTGYVGVWHLKETGSAIINEYRDSSVLANHGRGGKGTAAAVPTRVNGQIGYAQNFSNGDGTYDFVDVGNDGSLNLSGTAMTLEAWVRHNIVVNTAHGTPPATSTPYGILAHKGWENGYSLWLYGEDPQCPGSDTKPCVAFNVPGRSHSVRTNMTAGPSAGAWHHVVGTYDGALLTVYQDGAVVTTLAKTGNIAPSLAEADVWIGHGDLPNNVAWSGQFEGDVDEVRISNVSRSANWVLTQYRNQSAPAGFYAVGAETPGVTAVATYTVNLRSIGGPGTTSAGSVNATSGSIIVDGTGTTWLTDNRGRGDRITINLVDYTILDVVSETRLYLTSPFTSGTGPYPYTIARQFTSPQAWENCVSGGACPGVSSPSLVADNRSEVGILYYDGSIPGGSPVLTFDGSLTDGGHTITLTANPRNRHPGRSAASPTWAGLSNTAGNSLIRIWDGNVTVEWLDLFGGAGIGPNPIEIDNVDVGAPVTVRNNLIHTTSTSGSGIRINDPDTVASIHNNVIYDTGYGIRLVTDLSPVARLAIFNNTIFNNNGVTGPAGIKSTVRQTTQRIDLRNNIVHNNLNGDIGVASPFDRAYFFNGAYTQIGAAGVLGPTEYLADSTLNYTLNFTTVGTDCLYAGSQNMFRGLAVKIATGASGGADLAWTYWNGAAWTNLETTPFSDGTFNFQYNGLVHWSDDPAGWATTVVNGSPALYYVRACLASGVMATKPVEAEIARADVSVASTANLTSDMTGIAHSPLGGFVAGQNAVTLGNVAFVNTTTGTEDLHLQASSVAINTGRTQDYYFLTDIDATLRGAAWDVGADEYNGTTAVELQSFTAAGAERAVELSWVTASELWNLGFHVHRSVSAEGPFERITSSLIPGLGSSPTGASYVYRDAGLVDGQTYYYELEDVETTGRTRRHGPVSATPQAAGPGGGDPGGSGSEGPSPVGPSDGQDTGSTRITYGQPEAASFRIVERGPFHVLVELSTPGFYAVPGEGGSVRLEVPGLETGTTPGAPDLPVKLALVEAVAGRQVRVASIVASGEIRFDGLRVAAADAPALEVGEGGVVRAGRVRAATRARVGFFPRRRARVLEVVFQGETKKVRLELSPLRYDSRTGTLALSPKLLVRLKFAGVEAGERALGGARGKRPVRRPSLRSGGRVAELVTPEAGLHAVRYEEVLAGPRGVLSSSLRLSRQGRNVAFHLEPDRALFGPGSVLYFVSEGEKGNPWGDTVYELEVGRSGTRMPVLAAAPSGPPTAEYLDFREWEQNRFYQAALLEAPDLWLWDLLVSPVAKSYPFTLTGVRPSSTSAHLTVRLQGASDFEANPDHHVRVFVNGQGVGESRWDGRREQVIEAEVASGILQEGANTLSVENVGDTGASYSMVFLNRFSWSYPRLPVAEGGVLGGRWTESGAAVISGLGSGIVLDTSEGLPRWLRGVERTSSEVSFRAEAGRDYLAASPDSVKRPLVRRPLASSRLRSPRRGAQWLLVAPRELLGAAVPLVELRRRQGLKTMTVSLEEVEQEFGYGEHSPSALKEFLEHAYQSWPAPSLRYVVLLGDGSYDPKDYLRTGKKDLLSPYIVRTSYLWTASDPAYGAVNGEDLVPDLAVGRLPAANAQQAQALVDKIVAFESAGRTFDGRAVLVADNTDGGGTFEADADEIAATVLAGREVEKIYLRDLGGGTRDTIRAAFDSGPSLVSYAGHGGTAVWASENIFNNTDVSALATQGQQPLLLTLNCLNGFFHFPPLDSLAEAFLKAEERGAVAAFSPSGLSVNDAAHLYHKAVLDQIQSGRHLRLGDALLAAQSDYADTGALPELLSIYHLFGDPALRLR